MGGSLGQWGQGLGLVLHSDLHDLAYTHIFRRSTENADHEYVMLASTERSRDPSNGCHLCCFAKRFVSFVEVCSTSSRGEFARLCGKSECVSHTERKFSSKCCDKVALMPHTYLVWIWWQTHCLLLIACWQAVCAGVISSSSSSYIHLFRCCLAQLIQNRSIKSKEIEQWWRIGCKAGVRA